MPALRAGHARGRGEAEEHVLFRSLQPAVEVDLQGTLQARDCNPPHARVTPALRHHEVMVLYAMAPDDPVAYDGGPGKVLPVQRRPDLEGDRNQRALGSRLVARQHQEGEP